MILYNRLVVLVFVGVFLPLVSLFGQNTTKHTQSILKAALDIVDAHPDSAIVWADEAFQLSTSRNNYWAMSKSLELGGYAKEKMGRSDEAVADYFEALHWNIKADTNDYYAAFIMTGNIAAIQKSYMNFEQAVRYYDSALYYLNHHIKAYPHEAKKYQDYEQAYTIRYFKASSLRKQGQLEVSAKVLMDMIEEDQVPQPTYLNALVSLGLISRDLENYSRAEEFFSKTIERAGNDTLAIWRGQHGLALMKYQQKQYKEAIPLYQKAIQTIRPFSKSEEHLFISYLDLGESYFMLGEYKESSKYLNKALSSWSSDRINREPDFYAIYELLARVYLHIEPEESDQWIVKYAHSSEQFIAIQQRLKEENARRALDAMVKNRMDSLAHQEEEKVIVKRNIYYGLALLTIFALIGYFYHKISLKRKDKRLWDDSVKILENQD